MKKAESYIDHKLKPPKAFFEWCHGQFPTIKWVNKQETIETPDRKNCLILKKRLTKNSKLDFYDGFRNFAIVLVTSKRIEIQSYGFWSEYKEGKQIIESALTNFEQFAENRHIQVTNYFNGYIFGMSRIYGLFGGYYERTDFYPNDWKEKVLKISELKYLSLEGFTSFDLAHLYKYRKEIEFLQKIKAARIAEEVAENEMLYQSGSLKKQVDMRTITEKWLRENKSLLKNTNCTLNEFELERRIIARQGKKVAGIEKYLDYQDINKIPKKIGIVCFQNWVIKNEVDFNYYLDYLGLLKDLGITPDHANLIVPKDLTKAHDNAVKLVNQLEREVEENRYKERLNKILKYEKVIGKYAFIIPKKAQELITEGKTLHHCVGGSRYVEGHISGKTTVIFIRERSAPDTPFFTLEFKNKQVIQVRGKHNLGVPVEVEKAISQWLAWVKKPKKKSKTKGELQTIS